MINQDGQDRRRAVLLVEDDDLCRSSLTVLLKSSGFDVIAVENGETAVTTFEARLDEIAVVLLDVGLPGLSGGDTFRALRHLNVDLPILLTSGYDEETIGGEFSGLDYQGFVAKPGNPKKLEALIRRFTS